MQSANSQFCPYCGRRFPPVHQYRFCDGCGQPVVSFSGAPQSQPLAAATLTGQPQDGPSRTRLSPLIILCVGLFVVVFAGLVVYLASGVFSDGQDPVPEDTTRSLPVAVVEARIKGTVVTSPDNPPAVDYIVVTIENPISSDPFLVSGSDLAISYLDARNVQIVSYPGGVESSGFISSEDDDEAISYCSDLAKQPTYGAVWCYVNDGSRTSIGPGTSSDIYIFIGGLSAQLGADAAFTIELSSVSRDWYRTLRGQTPNLQAASPVATPEPTPSVQVPSTQLPTPMPMPGIVFPTFPTPQPSSDPQPLATLQPADTPQPIATPKPTERPVTLRPLPPEITRIPPHAFVGKATRAGQLVGVGTKITVRIEGFAEPVAEVNAFAPDILGNNYMAVVPKYGSALVSGITVLSFHIDGQDTGLTQIWEEGGATPFDVGLN